MYFDFITIGGAVEDITLYTDEDILINNKKDILRQKLIGFEYGAKVVIDKYDIFFGGGAANSAVCFSRLGYKTGALINIGNDDRGKRMVENFKKHKVNTSLIKKSKIEATGFSNIIIGSDGEHIVFTVRGANATLCLNFLEKKNLANTKWIYISSLSGNWQKLLKDIFIASKNKIAWNPGHIQLSAGFNKIKSFLKKTDILLVNKDEAIELVVSHKLYKKKKNVFLSNKKNLLKIIKGFGPEIIVITDGANGVEVYDGDKFYHQNSLAGKRKIVDTTGVGDAFCSSFVAGFYKYQNIDKAINLGMKNSASVLKKAGAQNGLIKL